MYAFARWDTAGAAAVICIANFTPLARPGYRVGLPWGGAWRVVLDTDNAAFWGSGLAAASRTTSSPPPIRAVPWQSLETSGQIDIGPMSMVWLASTAPPLPSDRSQFPFASEFLRPGRRNPDANEDATGDFGAGLGGASGCGARVGASSSRPATAAPNRPPRYHGKSSDSAHVNVVRVPPASGSSVNTPEPVTMPRVAHAHRHARHPLGDLHAVGQRDRPDLRVAQERRADATLLLALETDRDGVGHPVDVALDRLEVDHTASGGAVISIDTVTSLIDAGHRAHRGSDAQHRRSAAPRHASSGGTTLIITPVPRSKPACVTSTGQMWTCQWYSPVCWCGAVWIPRLKATSPSAPFRWAIVSRIARPTAASESSDACWRCDWRSVGTIIISYGTPLQNGQMHHDVVVGDARCADRRRVRPRSWSRAATHRRSGRRRAPRRGSRPARTAARGSGRAGGRSTPRPRCRG